MNLLTLSLAYLCDRPLTTCLNLLLLALGVGMIVLLMLTSTQFEQRLTRDAKGVDLVVGAKGSPLQLILSSVFHLDIPTGNIPITELERWRQHDLVEAVMPLALGDSLGGFRIVGTEHAYAEHYDAKVINGRHWQAPFEAVLGASVAERTGLSVGDRFFGNHGLAPGGPTHGEHPYHVVGVLSPTASVVDRLVLTSIESVWSTHGIEATGNSHKLGSDDAEVPPSDEMRYAVTSLLLSYRTPLAAVQLPPLVNQTAGLQAAAPALEMARLLSLIGIGVDTVRGFGFLLMVTAGLSVFIALFSALESRLYDLAVMRTMGASPRRLFAQLLLEGLLLALAGAILGLLLGHSFASLLSTLVPSAKAMGISGFTWVTEELYVVGLALLIGLLAALIPAIQAYRTDIAMVLASGR